MEKIDIIVRGKIVSWHHRSSSGVEAGNTFGCFYRDKPPTLEYKIESIKRGALKFLGFSEDQVEFDIKHTKGSW